VAADPRVIAARAIGEQARSMSLEAREQSRVARVLRAQLQDEQAGARSTPATDERPTPVR